MLHHVGICHYITPTSCWCSVIRGGARVWADDPERISWVVWWASLIILNTSFNISSQTSFRGSLHHNICKHIQLWRLGECSCSPFRSPVTVGAFIEMEVVYISRLFASINLETCVVFLFSDKWPDFVWTLLHLLSLQSLECTSGGPYYYAEESWLPLIITKDGWKADSRSLSLHTTNVKTCPCLYHAFCNIHLMGKYISIYRRDGFTWDIIS